MIDNDYTFGEAIIYCDGKKDCQNSLRVEGFDGHPPVWDEIQEDMKNNSWISKRVSNEWLHICPNCQNNNS